MKKNQTMILVAVIGLIGTVGAPIITLTVQHWQEQIQYPVPAIERLDYIIGTWEGEFTQKNGKGVPIVTETFAKLINKGRIISGDARFKSFYGRDTQLRLYNGVFDGNVLKIEYENEQGHVFQKGTIVGEMNAYGDTITGKFVGYSPEFRKIISGEITFSKNKT